MTTIRSLIAGLAVATVLGGCTVTKSAENAADTSAVPDGANAEIYAKVPDDLKKSGTLPMATDASYPPCESIDEATKEMVGFDPDLWNAMAALMGLKVEVTNTSLEGLRPGVESGRYRMAMECLNDLPEREKQVTFVDYMTISEMIVTLEENKGGVTDDVLSLCGRGAGVAAGMNFVDIVNKEVNPACEQAGKPAVSLHIYDKQDNVLTALYSKRDDFTFISSLEGPLLLDKAPQKLTLHDPLAGTVAATYMGIALKMDDTALQQAVLAAMTELHKNGTYDQIMDKWKVPQANRIEPGINLATAKPLS
jgi:polar amino acid transport system substrate-binding protein